MGEARALDWDWVFQAIEIVFAAFDQHVYVAIGEDSILQDNLHQTTTTLNVNRVSHADISAGYFGTASDPAVGAA